MSEPACPACGESELLRGMAVQGDIEVTCESCGAQWMRGEPRCKRCGRGGGTTVRQLMTTHPRGTLLSVIGARDVPLCGACDSEVLAAALENNQPVPEDYLSRFLFGELDHRAVAQPRATKRARPSRSPDSRPVAASEPTTPPARPPKPPPPAPSDPTVRQATEIFLNESGEPTDGLTMVLLGTQWGASTRLSRLDSEETAAQLSAWVERTFGHRPDQRSQAVATLRRALGHWRARGWLVQDLTSQLGWLGVGTAAWRISARCEQRAVV